MIDEHLTMSRNIRHEELKKLACRSLVVFLVMEFTICAIFKLPLSSSFLAVNMGQSMALSLKKMISFDNPGEAPYMHIPSKIEIAKSLYNMTNERSDVFEINGDIRVHSNSSTIFVPSSLQSNNMNSTWIVSPYARKYDRIRFVPVRYWNIHIPAAGIYPNCTRYINTPAVLFSTGAFSINHFHAFSDVLLPLYLTTRHFNGNVIFLITNYNSWWKVKYTYNIILNKLTKHEIVDIDKDQGVLCFSKLVVGLKSNKEFSVNSSELPEPPKYSIRDFSQFIRNTYMLKRHAIHKCPEYCGGRRPRMLIISRKRYRVLVNAKKVAKMAIGLGFDVVVEDLGPELSSVAPLMNSFDVLVGAHGAGLTNMLFLPENAVVIQIVPFAIEEISDTFFGIPARDMNFRYLEYKVSLNESTLLGDYPRDSEVLKDPHAIEKKSWGRFHLIFFRKQNINLDLRRFERTLLNAMKLIGT